MYRIAGSFASLNISGLFKNERPREVSLELCFSIVNSRPLSCLNLVLV